MEDSSKKLSEQLLFKAKNAYDDGAEGTAQKARDYAEGYKAFLDAAKTEREAVKRGIEMAEAEGFRPFRFGEKLERGGKYYYNNCGKSLYLFSLGSEDIERDGIRITAAHVDSPRLDLKQHPLFEEGGFSYFKTHYYGGIKKYQWVTIPLALHGVVVRADGSTVDVCVGEDESDPLFTIPDLLIHLASEQMTQPMNTGIKGENMNLLIGSEPFTDTEVSERVKLETMRLLSERYGITEEDFISAELSAVPAAKARDIGFDRSMVGAYGHDDRVCAYPELTALFECKDSCHTMLVILADKEETGSDGVTGMQSDVLGDVIHAISDAYGASDAAVRAASACLSADVSAAFDPMHADVYDRRNAAVMGGGVVMNKYTGSRGKYGTSDASAEFVGRIRRILDGAGVVWQTAELGKVDAGGGGTVAAYIARHGINTVDLGVPVLSMHAPYETISKVDLYMTHLALCAFNSRD